MEPLKIALNNRYISISGTHTSVLTTTLRIILNTNSTAKSAMYDIRNLKNSTRPA